jgi:hypothetical protein
MKLNFARACGARMMLLVGNKVETYSWTKIIGRPLVALACIAQIGCASSPDSVSARYVSPNMYQNWNCDQLVDEKMRLTKEVERIAGLQRENANADAALMTVGLIIFWPALIGLAATKDRKGELGQLKGEYDAVDLSLRSKQCTLPPPGAPSVPAMPTPQTDAMLSAAEGTYKGRGKTDTWCQTPSMVLTLRGTTIEGELSEVSSGNATSSISGTMTYSGIGTVDFKGTRPDYFSGRVDGVFKNDVFTIDIKSKSANSCAYHFELKKG